LRDALQQAFTPDQRGEPEYADLRLKLTDASARIDALQALEMSALRSQMRGEPMGIRPSMGKILATELKQHLTELHVQIVGDNALYRPPLSQACQKMLCLPCLRI
jgi:acyl-CoA dehydrogenase